jgi:cysteine desulfurase
MDKFVFATFKSTELVMEAKEILDSAGIESELIPKPLGLGAGCGVALKYQQANGGRVLELLKAKPVEINGFYPLPESEKKGKEKMVKSIYLDHNATTALHPLVFEAMYPYFSEKYGNASSVHSFGREARKAIDASREKIAQLLGAQAQEIIFTSGGTEANNLAIKGIAAAQEKKGKHIITSSIEHHAVLNVCKDLEKKGFQVSYLPVDKSGLIDIENLRKTITRETILITIMHANNEIGTIEPIAEIGKLAKEKGIIFHTDAVQSVGKIPVNVNELKVDLLSLSAHKFYGPKGIGVLYIRKGTKIMPLIQGGHHERNLRAGTENVPAIVGLAKALELAAAQMDAERKKIAALRDKLEQGIQGKIDEVYLNGHPSLRIPTTTNLSFKYVEGESIVLNLDLEGIAVSTGSACTSGTLEPSHVLNAMGVDPALAQGSVRFSLGRENTEEEIDYVLKVLPPIIERLRAMSPLYRRK